MGRKVVAHARWAILGASLWALGCQSGEPMHLSVMADSVGPPFVENKTTPYVNTDWQEDEKPSNAGLVVGALSTTGSAMVSVVRPIGDLTVKGFDWLTGERAVNADKLLEDPKSADNRREGMNRLADIGLLNNEHFRKRCRQMALDDTDPTVRATAIRTANRARDPQATSVFIKGLTDPNEWIRLEACKALANIPDVNAVTPLLAVMNNAAESRDIRVAAADALKHYRSLPVVRALADLLNDRIFVISWQARRSLRYLTDRDYGYDEAAWLTYFIGNSKAGK